MSERTEVSFDAALMMALRADAQRELDELPTPAQLEERYPDTFRWDARLKAALHKRRPVLKRVLVAAMTLVILTLGALAVSADSVSYTHLAVHLSHLPNGDGGLDSLIQAQGHSSFVSRVAPEYPAWELWCFFASCLNIRRILQKG